MSAQEWADDANTKHPTTGVLVGVFAPDLGPVLRCIRKQLSRQTGDEPGVDDGWP